MARIDTLKVGIELEVKVKVGFLGLLKLRLLGIVGYKRLMKDKIEKMLLADYMNAKVKVANNGG